MITWFIVVGSKVYDLREFESKHPGGAKVLEYFGRKDATEKFHAVEMHEDATKSHLESFLVGTLG